MAHTVQATGRAVGYNLLALPVALVLLFTAIGPAIVFVLVNAVLLGRELTEMTWVRYTHDASQAPPVSGVDRALLGGAMAGMLLIPGLGLLAPVIGTAAGTHLTHRAMGNAGGKQG